MSLTTQYFDEIARLLAEVREVNAETLQALGPVIGDSIATGGVLHLFGSGHSGILAQELVHRAGGLVPVSAVTDPTGGWAEIIPGYGEKLLQRHHYRYELRAGETLIVISNSGRNPSSIEVALAAKKLGLKVVALTSLEMSKASNSLHPSGQRLFECADYVLDNRGIMGDAILPIPGSSDKTAPSSTFTGAMILNLLALKAIEWMVANEHSVPVLRSANTPGAREYNADLSAKYKNRLSRPV